MDGTCFESRPFHDKVEKVLIERYADMVDPDNYKDMELVGGTEEDYLRLRGMPESRLAEAMQILDDTYKKLSPVFGNDAIMAYGLPGALRRIRDNGQKSILLSNSMQSCVEGITKAHGVMDFYDIICGATLEEQDKVDRIKRIIAENGFDPKEMLCIGDSKFDFEMANELGADSCFMDTPIAWAKDKDYVYDVLKPTYAAYSFDEIPDIFG